MATTTRPELSKSNRYWIDRHRYYELKHFCLQYPLWKRAYSTLDGFAKQSGSLLLRSDKTIASDPTAKSAEGRAWYSERMRMVEKTAEEACPSIARYLLEAVTQGLSYDQIKARLEIPCCKDTYYIAYRRFFWLLSRARK